MTYLLIYSLSIFITSSACPLYINITTFTILKHVYLWRLITPRRRILQLWGAGVLAAELWSRKGGDTLPPGVWFHQWESSSSLESSQSLPVSPLKYPQTLTCQDAPQITSKTSSQRQKKIRPNLATNCRSWQNVSGIFWMSTKKHQVWTKLDSYSTTNRDRKEVNILPI